jgi:pimeloyl-ACP methyl ester carboxylesterase
MPLAEIKAPTLRRLGARDGTMLCARLEGDGVPVLMLHEFATATSFDGFRGFFAGYRCIQLFARGYAPSAQPQHEAAYSQDLAVTDCLDALDGLGSGMAHVIGVSMGAGTALLLGLRHPERILSAVLMSVGGGGLPEFRRDWTAAQARAASRFEAEDTSVVARAFLGGASRHRLKKNRPALFEGIVADLAARPGAVSAAILRNVLLDRPPLTDLADELAMNRPPMLVISGGDDPQAVAAGTYLSDCGLEHVVVADAGHTPQLDRPEEVAGYALRLMRRSGIDDGGRRL